MVFFILGALVSDSFILLTYFHCAIILLDLISTLAPLPSVIAAWQALYM